MPPFFERAVMDLFDMIHDVEVPEPDTSEERPAATSVVRPKMPPLVLDNAQTQWQPRADSAIFDYPFTHSSTIISTILPPKPIYTNGHPIVTTILQLSFDPLLDYLSTTSTYSSTILTPILPVMKSLWCL
jgi:hypothetical protein